jgi:PKD repeat protein
LITGVSGSNYEKNRREKMKNNRKSIWKITLSVFTVLMMLTLLSTAASASITVYKTPLGAGTPPATERLSGGGNSIDYTAVAASTTDPRIVQFKDLSKGTETYIRWDFGDGTSLEGTKITPQLKNPVHKYAKTGYYISCLTIKCTGYNGKLWVHKTIIIK